MKLGQNMATKTIPQKILKRDLEKTGKYTSPHQKNSPAKAGVCKNAKIILYQFLKTLNLLGQLFTFCNSDVMPILPFSTTMRIIGKSAKSW